MSNEESSNNDPSLPETVNVEQEETNKTEVDEEKPVESVPQPRRVRFPTDDSRLRLISYASEPFSNQPLVSLGVISQRYRSTCQRLQTRLIPTLIEQLDNMDDGRKSFLDRLECLRIVNEKLDLKQVDALEEIFSRCRFYSLDLDSTFIDDSAFEQLLEVMEYYETCTHLSLANNRSIGYQGYQSLGKYLRKTFSLERLDMNSIRFDEGSILNLTRSLRLSTTLYELHVESCQLNGRILQKFVQNLRSCSSLRELYLCDNRLQISDSLLINELIRTCGQFLCLLDLRSNSLQDDGMSHLASQFSQYDEHHTTNHTLHKISFQSNQLTSQGIGFLAKSLLHNRTIRSLNLSNNNISNQGLFLLRDALLTNRTVNELILRNCRLTDQAAIALAEYIAESTTIHYIDLRENNFQASGICGMAIAIKNNKSLLKLEFDPILPVSTFFHSSSTKMNIDRSNQGNSLLSLTNLRRIAAGLGSFTSGSTSNSHMGGGTRELLEQKARWMNDISAVCQRNILIYEEKIRLQEEEEQQNRTANENEQIQSDSIEISSSNESNSFNPIESIENRTTEKKDENNSDDDDEQPALQHSDSIHLIREKVKNKDDSSEQIAEEFLSETSS